LLDRKENKVYTLRNEQIDLFSSDEKNTLGYNMDTQVSLEEYSLEELREEKKKEKTPVSNIKHKHGTLKNVFLTDEELEKLKSKFKDYQERIEDLSIYIGSSGKKYESHYLTILNWDRRDKKKEDKDGEAAKSIKEHQYIPRRDRQSGKDETCNS